MSETPTKSMTIVEFFDVYNCQHLMAFKSLSKTGVWPKGFLPEHVTEFENLWHYLLLDKMANAWITHNETQGE